MTYINNIFTINLLSKPQFLWKVKGRTPKGHKSSEYNFNSSLTMFSDIAEEQLNKTAMISFRIDNSDILKIVSYSHYLYDALHKGYTRNFNGSLKEELVRKNIDSEEFPILIDHMSCRAYCSILFEMMDYSKRLGDKVGFLRRLRVLKEVLKNYHLSSIFHSHLIT